MSRNEAQTRLELVDPCLIDQRGWPRANIWVEVTAAAADIVHGRGHRRPSGRADYVLCVPLQPGAEPIPMAIIETKRENLPARPPAGADPSLLQIQHQARDARAKVQHLIVHRVGQATHLGHAVADFGDDADILLPQRGLHPGDLAFDFLQD